MARIGTRDGELSADDYFRAAQDHASTLDLLFSRGNYVLTIYVAGLSVECLLRAYRRRRGLPFASDHKLAKLADEAALIEIVPEKHRVKFYAAISDLTAGWQNKHRFRSASSLRRFLKEAELDRGIAGDYLRENARQLASSALILIELGVRRWTSSFEN